MSSVVRREFAGGTLDPVVDVAALSQLHLGARFPWAGVIKRVERDTVSGGFDRVGQRRDEEAEYAVRGSNSGSGLDRQHLAQMGRCVGVHPTGQDRIVEMAPAALDVMSDADLWLLRQRDGRHSRTQDDLRVGPYIEHPPTIPALRPKRRAQRSLVDAIKHRTLDKSLAICIEVGQVGSRDEHALCSAL